jgi:hydrogenase maturation factor HypE
LWPYSVPIVIGTVVVIGGLMVVGAKVSGWF